jgi:hypothetical protein
VLANHAKPGQKERNMGLKPIQLLVLSAVAVAIAFGSGLQAASLSFSGYTWIVRPTGKGGPGPNDWSQENAFVDTNGWLHLRLTKQKDRWHCSEVYTQERLGFGRYEFWLVGRLDQLDQNVVLGLFNYPPSDVGPDGTHEIDIEFAQWGNASAPIGNYTVWPVKTSVKRESKLFSFVLNSDFSTHRFTWSPTNIVFQSEHGHAQEKSASFAHWVYQPADAAARVSQKAMPVHLNLWCFNGRPPTNGQPVELIVRAFKFTPL